MVSVALALMLLILGALSLRFPPALVDARLAAYVELSGTVRDFRLLGGRKGRLIEFRLMDRSETFITHALADRDVQQRWRPGSTMLMFSIARNRDAEGRLPDVVDTFGLSVDGDPVMTVATSVDRAQRIAAVHPWAAWTMLLLGLGVLAATLLRQSLAARRFR